MLSRHVTPHSCPTGRTAGCSSSSSGAMQSRPLSCVHAYKQDAYRPERQSYTPIPFKQQPAPYSPPQQQQQQQQNWVPAEPWQQQQQQQQGQRQQRQSIRWQQQQQQPYSATAASWQQDDQSGYQPQQQQQQQQQQRPRRRYRSPLLEQREALANQQEQQQQQQQQQRGRIGPGYRRSGFPGSSSSASSSEEDNSSWFVEQPLGTWTQQAPVMWRQQQQQQQQQMSDEQWREAEGLAEQLQEWLDQGDPVGPDVPVKLVSQLFRRGKDSAWFHERKYLQPSALHKEIMARSGRGQLEVAALTHLIRTASTPQEAALALPAVSAVRHVAIAQGRVLPWPDRFLKAFIKMTTICDSHEVLVSAMQRPNELGFVFKFRSVNIALKYWGSKLELHKLEQIMLVAATAGLPLDARMAYALVRACVNAQQWDKLDEVLEWFRGQGVTQDKYKPAMVKLLQAAAEQRARPAAAAAAAAAQGEQ